MKNKKAAIIIVNWNGKALLENCLNAVFAQSYDNFEVYLVDNGSIDGSPEFVKTNYPRVRILPLKNNYGFARGNNEGIRQAFKDAHVGYIVCLNNDTVVDKNWLNELVITAEKDEKTGAVGSLSLYPDRMIQTAGIKLLASKIFSEDTPWEMSEGHGQPADFFNREFEIFAPSGVSALYKREVLEKTGLFDEDFFSYCEDIDLGFRISSKGYRSFCNPRSLLTHFHSGTAGRASPLKAFYSKRNGFFVALKNFGFLDLLLYPVRDVLWIIKQCMKSKKNGSLEKLTSNIGTIGVVTLMLKIYLSGLVFFPKILLKRYREVKQ